MKELSIEEKARAYDEAIKRGLDYIRHTPTTEMVTRQDILEAIFPELKESEDEQHRKWILEYLYDGLRKSDEQFKDQFKAAIAWFERQGEKRSIWHNEYEEPQRGSLILLIMQSGTPIVAKIIEPNHTFSHGERWAYIDDLVEKQGQVKESLISQQENKTCKENDDSLTNDDEKIEPKFKVGDWILYSGDHYEGVRHITKINENGYYIERNGLPHGIIPFNHEIYMRLWTIQDAKDGDILTWDNSKCIALFKSVYNEESFCSYGYVGSCTGEFHRNGIGMGHDIKDAHPATKEQRELLFSKMHEAGYEWDAEKKELKEIEQKSAWSEEDERLWHSCIAHIEDELEQIRNDKYGHSEIISDLKESCRECVKWLKSLKGRVQSQPKQEWGEEDERILSNVLRYVDLVEGSRCIRESNRKEAIDWLKSLRPQNGWKPSEQQIKALESVLPVAAKESSTFFAFPSLQKLYCDLKKLRYENTD